MAKYSIINNENNINASPASVFITNANTAFAESALLPLATLDEDGSSFTHLKALFEIKDGQGNLIDIEETERGAEFKLTLIGIDPYLMEIIEEGAQTDTVANSTKAFTNQLVRFFGNNITELPFNNVKITAVTSTDSTPVPYTTSDITIMNDSSGVNSGHIKRSATSTIPSDLEQGTEVYITGTHKVNATKKINLGSCDNSSKNYYGLRVKLFKKSGALDIYDLYKVKLSAPPDVISFKNGEKHKVALTFKALYDPTTGNYGDFYYEENA